MMEETKMVFQAYKSANIIKSICDLYGISHEQATDIYYKSDTSVLIEEGVSDLQCRSDKYLATLIWDEFLIIHAKYFVQKYRKLF